MISNLLKALADLHRRWDWDDDVADMFDKIAEQIPF